MKHKLESRSPGEISITSDKQKTSPLWQKEPLDEVNGKKGKKVEDEKAVLKLNIQKLKIIVSDPKPS